MDLEHIVAACCHIFLGYCWLARRPESGSSRLQHSDHDSLSRLCAAPKFRLVPTQVLRHVEKIQAELAVNIQPASRSHYQRSFDKYGARFTTSFWVSNRDS